MEKGRGMKYRRKKHLIECSCGAVEHQAVLSYWPDEEHGYRVVYLQIHLIAWERFFRRLWVGIKYICGYRSRYGHWDEIIIDPEEAADIADSSGIQRHPGDPRSTGIKLRSWCEIQERGVLGRRTGTENSGRQWTAILDLESWRQNHSRYLDSARDLHPWWVHALGFRSKLTSFPVYGKMCTDPLLLL